MPSSADADGCPSHPRQRVPRRTELRHDLQEVVLVAGPWSVSAEARRAARRRPIVLVLGPSSRTLAIDPVLRTPGLLDALARRPPGAGRRARRRCARRARSRVRSSAARSRSAARRYPTNPRPCSRRHAVSRMKALDQLLGGVADPSRAAADLLRHRPPANVSSSARRRPPTGSPRRATSWSTTSTPTPRSRIRIGLPTHWLRFVWILSAWNVGAAIVDSAADIGLSGPELEADERHRVAASLRPLGGRFVDRARRIPRPRRRGAGARRPLLRRRSADRRDRWRSTSAGHRRTHADVLATSPDDRRIVVEPGIDRARCRAHRGRLSRRRVAGRRDVRHCRRSGTRGASRSQPQIA